MIQTLKPKDYLDLKMYVEKFGDRYDDFYFTINRERKYFRDIENSKLYLDKVRRGEICFVEKNMGVVCTWGISDKSHRIYLKILYNNPVKIKTLLKSFFGQYGNKDFYIKIKSNNRLKDILVNNSKFPSLGFVMLPGIRGNDILFYRKATRLAYLPESILEEKGDLEEDNASYKITGKRFNRRPA